MMKKITFALLVIFGLSAGTASALTIVRQDGQAGARTTLAGAIAVEPDGGTIQIQQFNGPFSEATLTLSNRTLTATTATHPVIHCTQNTGINVTNGQVQKVNLIGVPVTSQFGIKIAGSATVNDCQISTFSQRGISINVPAGQACTVSNTFVNVRNAADSVIGIDNQGGVTLNHCTLIGNPIEGITFANINVNVNNATYTASNITVQNCILQGCDLSIGAYGLTNATFALNHAYNNLYPQWQYIKWNNNNSDGVLGTGEIQNVDPVYRNPVHNDYRIAPISPCVGAGAGGSNIGADITTLANAPAPTDGDTLVGADALGRVLPGYATCGPKNPGRFVGVQFEAWEGPGIGYGPYDISQMLAQNPNPTWPGAQGTWFWWGQPELGYYYSNDNTVIRQHAQMLNDAGVDTIIVDCTNVGFTFQSNWIVYCAVWQAMRNAGGATPQICFLVANQATAQNIYDNFYSLNLYPDLWFKWGGKPLMATQDWYGSYSATLQNFFTFRQSWAWTHTGRPYYNKWFSSNTSGYHKWPWLDDYPQNFGWTTNSSLAEEVVVECAQHPDELAYPTTSGGIGRSFSTTGYGNGSEPTPGQPGPFAQTPNGVYFNTQWSRALSLNWDTNAFIWITSWNEWIAQEQIATDTSHKLLGNTIPVGGAFFVDQYDQEFSRDAEPMKGGHTDNYYYQMTGNIRRFKGVHPDPIANAPITIAIDGQFSDWTNVTPVYRDYVSDAWQRNTVDWNGLKYDNNTGRNDFTVLKVTNDANNVYFYAECLDNISPCTDPNWMWLFINKDMDWTTGWQGYDYLVNFSPVSATQTTLKQATTTAWSWTTLSSTIAYAVNGNKMEICIPRASLGLGSGATEFYFKWADNVQTPGNIADFSMVGDSAPNRRLAYHYKSNAVPVNNFVRWFNVFQ